MDQFEKVYRQYVRAVYRAVLRSVVRVEIAEEITSDVFMQLHKHWESDVRERLPEWLFTVARNRSADYWRARYREMAWMQTASVPVAYTPRPEIPLTELLKKCPDLKPVHRQCILLRFAYRMSQADIAAQLGLKETQIKHNLQYALKLLRRDLERPNSRYSQEREAARRV